MISKERYMKNKKYLLSKKCLVSIAILSFLPSVSSCKNVDYSEQLSSESIEESKQKYDENEVLTVDGNNIQDLDWNPYQEWWNSAKFTRKAETVKSVDVYFGNNANIIGLDSANDPNQSITFTLYREVFCRIEYNDISRSTKEILSLKNSLGFFASSKFSFRDNHMIDHISVDDVFKTGKEMYIYYYLTFKSNDERPIQIYKDGKTIYGNERTNRYLGGARVYYGVDGDKVYFRGASDKYN